MLFKLGFSILISVLCGLAHSQSFPSRSINIIVPFSAGGAADAFSRIFADHMGKTLGESIVVQNRPGANANIAHTVVARAQPDGYTLLSSSTATSVNPYLEDGSGWRVQDLTPIARIAISPSVFVVPASSGQKTLKDFVEFARNESHLPTTASSLGNAQAMARITFAEAAGIRFTGVGYKGGATFVPDLVNGSLVFAATPITIVQSLIDTGKLTPLATTGEKRSPSLPDVPTLHELGYDAASVVSWFGLHAPAETPSEVLHKIAAAAKLAAEDPEVKAKVAAAGGEVDYMGTEEFRKFIQSEMARSETYANLIKRIRTDGQLP